MATNHQKFCIWSGVYFFKIYIIGWALVSSSFPPQPATFGAEEIAAYYASNTGSIRAGLLIALLGCAFYIPWVVGISEQLRKIKGSPALLTEIQSISGSIGMTIFLFPLLIWLTATFRPDRDPALVQLINDLGWLTFVMTFAPFVAQFFAIAVAILGDKDEKPVFPRWFAYLTIWSAISFVPAVLAVFFKSGPFAWDGLVGIWIPLVMFAVWLIAITVLMLKVADER